MVGAIAVVTLAFTCDVLLSTDYPPSASFSLQERRIEYRVPLVSSPRQNPGGLAPLNDQLATGASWLARHNRLSWIESVERVKPHIVWICFEVAYRRAFIITDPAGHESDFQPGWTQVTGSGTRPFKIHVSTEQPRKLSGA